MFDFRLKNTGAYKERYIIDVDNLRNDITLTENPVWLRPGEERTVFMNVDADCDMESDTDFQCHCIYTEFWICIKASIPSEDEQVIF